MLSLAKGDDDLDVENAKNHDGHYSDERLSDELVRLPWERLGVLAVARAVLHRAVGLHVGDHLVAPHRVGKIEQRRNQIGYRDGSPRPLGRVPRAKVDREHDGDEAFERERDDDEYTGRDGPVDHGEHKVGLVEGVLVGVELEADALDDLAADEHEHEDHAEEIGDGERAEVHVGDGAETRTRQRHQVGRVADDADDADGRQDVAVGDQRDHRPRRRARRLGDRRVARHVLGGRGDVRPALDEQVG